MKKYEVLQTVTLTVETGSVVILTENQYELVKNCVKIITNKNPKIETEKQE